MTRSMLAHCNKSKISYTFTPKKMCRKHYVVEQISDSLRETLLDLYYNVLYVS